MKRVWPKVIIGPHHRIIAEAFQRIANGTLKRLIINMPPRVGKSEFASCYFPAWSLGRNPEMKLLTATHTKELSDRFGRKVRDLIAEPIYQDIFPNVQLRADSKAAGRWDVKGGGEFFAVSVGAKIAGRGANLFVIDDPHAEEAMREASPEYFEDIFNWYTSGPRQRLQPDGAIVIVMTRWSEMDLTAKVTKNSKDRGGDQWEVIELPMELPNGEPLWPEYWKKEDVAALKAELPIANWMAQYQQKPSSEGAALIKREWWKTWTEPRPPACDYLIQTWDTAHTTGARSDYSACTTWGVFYREDAKGIEQANIILLDALWEKMEFPALKTRALELYQMYNPDAVLIEAKAAGAPLAQELRAIGIPLQTYTPSRGNDKIVRVNAVADIFASGLVWRPETRFADEVVEQCAVFPRGAHDDLVDCTSMALMRFRQGGFVTLKSDLFEEQLTNFRRREPFY